jgi:xanthine dehydrogenase/oxidase
VLADPGTLEGLLDVLSSELDLQFDVPGGMATYRKTLALSFIYKYWHEVVTTLSLCPEQVPTKGLWGPVNDITGHLERKVTTGIRDNRESYTQPIVGSAIPHLSGLKHTTGEAIYTDDMPRVANEGYGALVVSERAHAKLIRVDHSPALDLPGVLGWVDHRDLSETANRWGPPSGQELFFAVDEVVCHGQPIGLVVAETKFQALAAARAVIVEYEDLPAILTIEEAIAQGSFYLYDHVVQRGQPPEEAMAKADYVFEGECRLGGQEHFYLETQACLVLPKLEDGEMEIWSSTQSLMDTQVSRDVAVILKT